ncbi:hypothetical protein N0V82_008959 [Gnomoniopsis sp. IMI 355080]|nr:hypothetical protein N0V82_008959 [Gnomoniopsis sp. IMI 355080]
MEISEGGSDALTGLTATKLWPRRLLDVTRMKSFERKGGNMYGHSREPAYSVISYTWGRWQTSDGPRLQIDGITWKVPALKGAFAVEEFHRVLIRVGERTGGLVWVDIACIDQENYAVKMDEIGRQAGIFQNASFAYVWLWTLPKVTLKASVDTLLTLPTVDRVQEKFRGSNEVDTMRQLLQAVSHILRDGWFSSLWTLQDAFLRTDAVCLPLEGEYINPRPGWRSIYIGSVMRDIWKILMDLDDETQRFDDPQANELAALLRERIREAGLIADPISENPNIQYGACRFRKTTKELDRIYGIMAIYDIQVGAAVPGADTTKAQSLEGLEQEFAAILNARSPFLGQYFVHLSRPIEGKSWQITQNSRVPWCDYLFTSNGFRRLNDCTITAVSGEAYAKLQGLSLPLEIVFEYWKAALCKAPEAKKVATGAHKYLYPDYWHVVLDDHICKGYPSLPYMGLDYFQPSQAIGEHAYHLVSELLALATFAETVSVVVLGEEPSNHWPSRTFGLLILHQEVDRTQCQRIGVCAWETCPEGFDAELEKDWVLRWRKYEGIIH